MASPKPPRSPMSHPRRPPSQFRRSESSPEMKASVAPRIPTVPEVVGTCISSTPYPSVSETTSGTGRLSMSTRYSHGFTSRSTSSWPPSLPEFPALEELAQKSLNRPADGAQACEGSSGVDFRRGLLRRSVRKNSDSSGGPNEWCIPLVGFSLVCLVSLVATLVYSIQIVERYENEMVGRFIHVSDIHFDPLYRPASNPALKCRTDILNSTDLNFGQYGCDSPLQLVRSALEEAARVSHQPDFILITGDTAAHNLTSTNEALRALMQVDLEVHRAFLNPSVKILYAIGESELFPEYLDTGMTNSMWLSRLAAAWNDSLSMAGDDALQTFQKGGYYTAIFDVNQRSPRPMQMAVIVLNTLLYSVDVSHPSTSSADPAGQLAWLEEQLTQARHWGRSVLIAGHRPPGVKDMTKGRLWRAPFEERYTDIILRHSDVVVGQLFGYLHRDQFRLMTAGKKLLATGGAQVAEVAEGEGDVSREAEGGGKERNGGSESVVDTEGPLHPSVTRDVSREGGALGGLRRAMVQLSGRHGQFRGQGGRFLAGVTLGRKRGWGWGWGWAGFGLSQGKGVDSNSGEKKSGVGDRGGEMRSDGRAGVPGGSLRKRQVAAHLASAQEGSSAGSLILMAPSLSPKYENRPAFRVFQYDRWKRLIDYTEHTAELTVQQPQMWGAEYSPTGVYGIESLDSHNLGQVSSSFFNTTGHPTSTFMDFCSLRVAGRHLSSLPSDAVECCEKCPRHMHCSVAYSTFMQYQDCSKRVLP